MAWWLHTIAVRRASCGDRVRLPEITLVAV
jgi:hypothetical protein